MRLPSVIVPVLSNSSTSTSPAASIARPLMASTFLRISRSMPAMPMAESSPPIVVGIRQTSSATITVADRRTPEYSASGTSVAQANRKTSVKPTSRMCRAISFGVFCRAAPSTSAIIRSRNDSPGFDVIRTTMRSESTLRAAGHRRAIAAAFADHGGRLAGDGRLVDRGDALDDFAVAGDVVARPRPRTWSPLRRAEAGTSLFAAVVQLAGDRLVAHLAQRVGLGLAAALGDRLGEVGEQHREPQPERDRNR